jgi:predicted DCC family thiol-disulfide oxidoreductase YuxK
MISVHTETSERSTSRDESTAFAPQFQGWILFDAGCSFCRRCVAAAEPILAPRGFVFLPLQTPWVRAFFHLPEEKLLGEMRLLTRNRQSFGGADAILELAKHVWWAWLLFAFAQFPGAHAMLGAAYRSIAARRQCLSGSCSMGPDRRATNSKMSSRRFEHE